MCALLVFASCKKNEPIDEAKAAGKSTADFPQVNADIFKPMDGGIDLSPEEIRGRNTWNLWSGGNEHFWNHVAQDSFGLIVPDYGQLYLAWRRHAAAAGVRPATICDGPRGESTSFCQAYARYAISRELERLGNSGSLNET
jgi:hypothetical protein